MPPTCQHPQDRAYQHTRQRAKQCQYQRLPGACQHERLHISPNVIGPPGKDGRGGKGRCSDHTIDDRHPVDLVGISLGQPLAEQRQADEAHDQKGTDEQCRVGECAAQHPPRPLCSARLIVPSMAWIPRLNWQRPQFRFLTSRTR